eukprot:1337544-Amorphochlora_amoeboformis.AAC.1
MLRDVARGMLRGVLVIATSFEVSAANQGTLLSRIPLGPWHVDFNPSPGYGRIRSTTTGPAPT